MIDNVDEVSPWPTPKSDHRPIGQSGSNSQNLPGTSGLHRIMPPKSLPYPTYPGLYGYYQNYHGYYFNQSSRLQMSSQTAVTKSVNGNRSSEKKAKPLTSLTNGQETTTYSPPTKQLHPSPPTQKSTVLLNIDMDSKKKIIYGNSNSV